MTSGLVDHVTPVRQGDTLTTDTPAASTVLVVDDAGAFDERAGGWVVVGDEGSTPLQYVAVENDEDAAVQTLTLAAPTVEVYEAGLPVTVWDPTVEGADRRVYDLVAMVRLDDHPGSNPIPATLRHETVPLAGVRSLEGARVTLDVDDFDELYVAEVTARNPAVDGQFVRDPLVQSFLTTDRTSIADSTWTRVASGWVTEEQVTLTGGGSGWWTVEVDGLYAFIGTASFEANGSGGRQVRIGFEVDGLPVSGVITTAPADPAQIAAVQVIQEKRLVKGNRFSLEVRQTSGAALDLRGNATGTRTALSARRVRA